MIIVLGSVLLRDGALAEGLALSLDHVRRSRAEPGCVSHAVHTDAEQPLRLVFVERWADRQALADHFKVPASRAFAKALGALASAPPEMTIYQATELAV